MEFNRNTNKPVIALLGAGAMGTAIIRKFATNRIIVLGDISEKNLDRVGNVLRYDGYEVYTKVVDATSKESTEEFAQYCASLGDVMYFVHTAGASPNQASPEHIVKLDLVGTAYAIDAFAKVIARGGAGLVISSQAGHMVTFTPEEERLVATTPTDELENLDIVKNKFTADPGIAYVASKRCNHLRVRTAAATTWGDRGARINTISPGIIVTPLAYDEFQAAGEGYQKMIDESPMKRVGTIDEIANAGAFLLSDQAGFITGTDLLMDGGVIAAMNSGR